MKYLDPVELAGVRKTLKIRVRPEGDQTGRRMMPKDEWRRTKFDQRKRAAQEVRDRQASKPAGVGWTKGPHTIHQTVIGDPGKFVMPWGKHKGEEIGSIYPGYIEWLLDQRFVTGSMRYYLVEFMKRRADSMDPDLKSKLDPQTSTTTPPWESTDSVA
jgi:uncharacterized protein (DUF3820 family)